MILSTNEYMEKKFYIGDIAKICKNFIRQHNIIEMPCGKYLIDSENIYVNIVNYETKDESQCIWEAHRKYLDIHYIIEGEEKIKLADVRNMQINGYIEESDYVKMEGVASTEIILKPEDFLVLFFEDAHMTGVNVNKPEIVKKAIFKVKRNLIEE